ncbi:hypothetical protein ACRS6B_27985 [Nocardia asteroides]
MSESSALPSPSSLLCALGGYHVHGPVSRWARELTELYRRRREDPASLAEIDERRAELRNRLDTWTALRLPGAVPREVGLGEMIDRMAAVAEEAFHLLMHDDPGGERMHAAWTRLAEWEIAYAELVRAVGDGRRILGGERMEPSPSSRRGKPEAIGPATARGAG